MRDALEHLKFKAEHIDYDNLYGAVVEIKEVLVILIELMDKALPVRSADD